MVGLEPCTKRQRGHDRDTHVRKARDVAAARSVRPAGKDKISNDQQNPETLGCPPEHNHGRRGRIGVEQRGKTAPERDDIVPKL